MKLSIIIPVWNASRTIRLCLDGIMHQTIKPYEVIVIDDRSTDNSSEIIKRYNVKLLQNTENKGPAYSRNRGAKIATGDIFLFVDSDIVIPANAVALVIEKFKEIPDATCICGIYSKYPLIDKGFISYYRTLQTHIWKKTGCGFTTRFTVSSGAIKKEAFQDVGGFDETFKKADIEDYEIGHRLIAKGYKIYQTNEIQTLHGDYYRLKDLIAAVFKRAYFYFPLLFKRKKVDTGYLNKRRMLTYPLSIVAAITFILSFFNVFYIYFGIFLLMIMIILDAGLYNSYRKEKGFLFMLRCIPLHYFITLIMACGFIVGGINFLMKNEYK